MSGTHGAPPATAGCARRGRGPSAPVAPPAKSIRDPMDTLPEAELVRRGRAGDVESFTPLVARYQRLAFGLAFRILRNREDADDVTQDAFVTAFRNLHGFDGRAAFSTWLGRIVLNRSLDALRRRRWAFRWNGNGAEASARSPEAPLAALVDPGPGPEEAVERRQLADGLDRLLDTLPPRQRVVFILRHLQRLSTREVALLTGLDEGSVKTHLFRAVRKLRAGLQAFR